MAEYLRAIWIPALTLVPLIVVWPRIAASRAWTVTALGFVLVLGLIHQLLFGTLAEDAFITFRYAMNLANGRGAAFNPGERVEGYSDFLWMVTLAGAHRLLGADVPTTARVLGALAGLLSLVFTYRLTLEVTEQSREASLIATLLVAASGSFATYAQSGMETPLFALTILSMTLCTIQQMWVWAGFLVGLSMMIRPEGVLLLLPLAGWIMFAHGRAPDKLRNLTTVAASVGVVVAPWTLWRWLYYQSLIPNVLRAKEGMEFAYQVGLGFEYLLDYCVANVPIVLLLAVAVTAGAMTRLQRKTTGRNSKTKARRSKGTAHRRPAAALGQGTPSVVRRPPVEWLVAGVLMTFSVFVVLVGGDWMPAWRFLAPLVPIAAVLLLALWRRNVTWPRLRADSVSGVTLFAVVAAYLFAQSFVHPRLLPRVKSWSDEAEGLSEIGRWFRRSLPSDTLIAVLPNGALPYYSELPTIDMMGLTDEHIARDGDRFPRGMPGHVAHDWEYVAARKPAVVAFVGGQGFEAAPDRQRFKHEFEPDYDMVVFRFPKSTNPLGQYVNLLLLRSDKARLVSLLTATADVEVVP